MKVMINSKKGGQGPLHNSMLKEEALQEQINSKSDKVID